MSIWLTRGTVVLPDRMLPDAAVELVGDLARLRGDVPGFEGLGDPTGARSNTVSTEVLGPHTGVIDQTPVILPGADVTFTVTDADLTLGYLNADFFLGGCDADDLRRQFLFTAREPHERLADHVGAHLVVEGASRADAAVDQL